jgi:hypothetical protein
MVLIVLLAMLAGLGTYTWWQPTGLDFLRVNAFPMLIGTGIAVVKVSDLLTGLAILGVVALTRGPLMVASAAMFVLWMFTLFGVSKFAGLDVRPLIAYIVVAGGIVQVVTYKDH